MSRQLHPDLQAYIDGKLTPAEMTAVEAHLENCDECHTWLDEIWARYMAALSGEQTPELSDEAARSMERRLLNQIHRSDLGGQALDLGTRGFFQVLLAMIKPLFSRNSPHKKSRSTP